MTSNLNEKAARGEPDGSNFNDGKCTACTCGTQGISPPIQGVRRIDFFAAVAMAGILASRPADAFELCDDGEDLALACAHAARAMEMAAMAMGAGL